MTSPKSFPMNPPLFFSCSLARSSSMASTAAAAAFFCCWRSISLICCSISKNSSMVRDLRPNFLRVAFFFSRASAIDASGPSASPAAEDDIDVRLERDEEAVTNDLVCKPSSLLSPNKTEPRRLKKMILRRN
ncbi:unnamed protein product [Pseudo-nitzschia multistriata]|uniref:Uncharacterized protein n=1 Tax=Pseudo-nitzschia multistriata TaxID=183589 RepID=A0A448ZGV5_9STRA|nr:unnamed protein product [Pseudo-nitzschia multistriata]